MSDDPFNTVSFREHLCCFSVVNASMEFVLPPLSEAVERHGRVTKRSVKELKECLEHLRPIMSFPTRHVAVGLGARWSLVACNMRFEDAGSPARAVGRALGVLSLSVSARESERRFTVAESGQIVRQVECFQDFDSPWEFRERGIPRAFENTAKYRQRPMSSRLTTDDVRHVFSSVTGLPWVDFDRLASDLCYTFETPVSGLAQAPVMFKTID